MKRLLLAMCPLFILLPTQVAATNNIVDANINEQSHSPEIQPLSSIKGAVENFVLSQQHNREIIEVKVKDLDRRLRLAYCQDALEADWSPGSRSLGRVTVKVQCASPKPWRVHVQATVTMESMVWTLSRGVRRGDVLDRELLVEKKVTLGGSTNALTSLGTPIIDLEPWLGFVFTQRVNAGKVVNERMLKPAKLITKGEAVVIRHSSKGLELQTRGTALRDAGAQEQTQVRNTSSGKIIDVVVVASGVVEILN